MVKAATQATIPVHSKTSESIRTAQMDLFLSQLIQLPIFSFFSVFLFSSKSNKYLIYQQLSQTNIKWKSAV